MTSTGYVEKTGVTVLIGKMRSLVTLNFGYQSGGSQIRGSSIRVTPSIEIDKKIIL